MIYRVRDCIVLRSRVPLVLFISEMGVSSDSLSTIHAVSNLSLFCRSDGLLLCTAHETPSSRPTTFTLSTLLGWFTLHSTLDDQFLPPHRSTFQVRLPRQTHLRPSVLPRTGPSFRPQWSRSCPSVVPRSSPTPSGAPRVKRPTTFRTVP